MGEREGGGNALARTTVAQLGEQFFRLHNPLACGGNQHTVWLLFLLLHSWAGFVIGGKLLRPAMVKVSYRDEPAPAAKSNCDSTSPPVAGSTEAAPAGVAAGSDAD